MNKKLRNLTKTLSSFILPPSSLRVHPSSFRLRLVACAVSVVVCVGGQLVSAHAAVVGGGKNLERGERAMREGEFEEAEKLFREMLAKSPRDTGARLALSYALLKQRRHQEAFDAAARVIATEPMSARAHALLGAALLGSGDFRQSVEEFRTALSLREGEALAISGLAMVDFYENRLSQSLEGLRRAAFIDPYEPDYHFNLGQVAARTERYGEAADSYERFLRIAPRTDADRRARIRGLIDFLRYLGAQRSLIRPSGEARVQIPFEIVNNRPVIRVSINDSKEPLRFVIDTGAGMSVLSTQAAERLGVKPVARGGMARAVGGPGRFEIVYGFLRSLQLGEARLENVPIYIRQFFNERERVDGYIGISVLAKYLTEIDYRARTMTLLRDDERARSDGATAAAIPPGAIEIPIRITSSGFWSGEVQLDGVAKPLNFIMDTGATITVVSEDLMEREDMTRFTNTAKTTIYGAAGISNDVRTLVLPRFRIGSHARSNVPAAVLDMDAINETAGFEQAGIVGGNILRHFRLTFDFQRAVVRLEPFDKPTPAKDDARLESSGAGVTTTAATRP